MMGIMVIGNGVAGEAACSAIQSRTQEIKIALISKESYPFYSSCILPKYISREVKRSDLFLKGLSDYEKERIHLLLGNRVERIDSLRTSPGVASGFGYFVVVPNTFYPIWWPSNNDLNSFLSIFYQLSGILTDYVSDRMLPEIPSKMFLPLENRILENSTMGQLGLE